MSRANSPAPWRARLKRSWDVLLELMQTLGGSTGSGYRGAMTNRAHPGGASIRSANQEILRDMITLRARARDVRRNSPYVQMYLFLEQSNVLGGPDQPIHQAQVLGADGELDETVNDKIEAAFRRWARRPISADGRMNLAQFRRLQLETWRVDGEAFTRLVRGKQYRHGLALQAIDPDLIDEKISRPAGKDGPEIRMGVEVDENGRPLGYHAWTHAVGDPARRLIRYDASEILHHFRPRRANQTRGVSELAPVILDLMDIDGFEEAVIEGARAAARQLATIYWQDPTLGTPPDPNDPTAIGRKPEYVMDDTTLLELAPGQRMDPFVPQQPTSVYGPFLKTRLQRLGCGTGSAYAGISNDLSGANFSSMRAGALIERDIYVIKQDDWNGWFEIPVHEAWLEMALLTGDLQLSSRDPRPFLDVEIESRGWDWVNPKDDAQTAEIEIGLGLTSRTRIHRRRGTQFAKTLLELEREQREAERLGIDVAPKAPAAPANPAAPNDVAAVDDPSSDTAGDAGANGSRSANRLQSAIANGHAR